MTKKKTTTTEKGSATLAPAGRSTFGSGQPPTAAERQLATWDAAVRLFTERKFLEACQSFAEAAKGPAANISDKARSYLQICERKVTRPAFDCQTAEDHFNYAVERINARDFDQARIQLSQATVLQPDGDHIFYALALCCGLSGDANGACENLKRAIDLEPRNRILARQDPEFSALAAENADLRAIFNAEYS